MASLGMARTAEVKRDARIGEAEARSEAQIREAVAEEQRMASVLKNDTEMAEAKRDFELKKAAYDVEIQTKVTFQPNQQVFGMLKFGVGTWYRWADLYVFVVSESRGRIGLRAPSCKDKAKDQGRGNANRGN